ncbi:hypothetical protein HN873_015340 [Arachis hypogaea]|nr:uncharacterized protein DS421_5g147850 [Arachis hypogaea]
MLHSVGRWSSTVSSTVKVKTRMGTVQMIVSDIIMVLTKNTMKMRSLRPEVVPKQGKKVLVMVSIVGGSGGANEEAGSVPSQQVFADDFLGRDFATEEDAYAAYKEFARLRGFGVRKGDVARVNGVLVRRDFLLPSTRDKTSQALQPS